MKKNIIKILIVSSVAAVALGIIGAVVIPMYPKIPSELQDAKSISASSIINKPFLHESIRDQNVTSKEIQFDPMSLIDATFDIYTPIASVGVTTVPKDSYIYKEMSPGEAIMYRQNMGNGYHKVQDIDGKVYYINDDDMKNNMSFIERKPSAIVNMQEIPEGSVAYVVKYDGDRVLRFTKKLMLEDNVAEIMPIGEIVYKVRDYEQIFFIVAEDGRSGYMNSQCLEILEPEESPYDIVTADDSTYDYNEMLDDIVLLTKRYTDDLKVVEVGYSTLGNAIPVLLLGDENAEIKILFQASIHAREYASTPTLMKQLEVMLYHLDQPNSSGTTYRHVLDQVAYYIMPMTNPDGVLLSQIGTISIEDEETRSDVLDIRDSIVENKDSTTYKYYFEQWKGNINGVDLNRNFDANWDKVHDSLSKPSNNGYKGPSIFSEIEAQFIKKYVDKQDVKVTVSYHTAGNMIFWWYFQDGIFYDICYDLAKIVRKASRYQIMSKAQSRYSHGGVKDYGVMIGKPSITYEIGKYSSPIPPFSVTRAAKLTKVIPIIGEWLIDEINDQALWLEDNLFVNVKERD
ncbi:MAG: hypothetical protein KAQ68_01390 [Clostridiales bacterium]|nr:hypothetical protein [Clostridiales bacterium]